MPSPRDQPPVFGNEVIIERDDGVLLKAHCENDGTGGRVWFVSDPDEDTTIDEARIVSWFPEV